MRVSPARFQVEYILSEPREGWRGRKGRVDGALLQDLLIRPDGSRCFVCVCGPTAFTELAVRWVDELQLPWFQSHTMEKDEPFLNVQSSGEFRFNKTG